MRYIYSVCVYINIMMIYYYSDMDTITMPMRQACCEPQQTDSVQTEATLITYWNLEKE